MASKNKTALALATAKASKAKPAAPVAKAPKAAPLPLNTPAGLAQMALQRYANPNGKCGAVWAYARALHVTGTLPTVAGYMAANPSANLQNTKIELGYWARATGVSLPRQPRTVAATVAQAATA